MARIERICDVNDRLRPLLVTRRASRKTPKGRTIAPSIRIRCGDCSNALEIYYDNEAIGIGGLLEIGGVEGTVDQWRKILLPLLGVEAPPRTNVRDLMGPYTFLGKPEQAEQIFAIVKGRGLTEIEELELRAYLLLSLPKELDYTHYLETTDRDARREAWWSVVEKLPREI